jgi:hypothetical protein
MKLISRQLPYLTVVVLALLIGTAAVSAFGQDVSKEKIKVEKAELKGKQKGFCNSNSWSSEDRVSYNEIREMTVSAGGTVAVDGRQNGGISVTGEDRADVLVRACVQAWGKSDGEARALAESVRIGTGPITTESSSNENWSVSYDVRVPRSTNLDLKAHNGGIAIANVDGTIGFETMNGGVSLNNLSGDVKGKTINGGVNVALTGAAWKGTGLDVTTTNGGVNVMMPANFAAHVETGTVNGGFSSDIPSLNAEKPTGQERPRATRISTDINGGGVPIKLRTTNGGVRINSGDAVRL